MEHAAILYSGRLDLLCVIYYIVPCTDVVHQRMIRVRMGFAHFPNLCHFGQG
jgi:hypothetical protein